jgi:hypothetical protein
MSAGQFVRRKRVAIPLVAATVAALGIGVSAAIPDPNGVIHGCYKQNNGDLRLVDDPSQCQNSESAIFWNQQGIQGEQGPPGVLDFYVRTEQQTFAPPVTVQFNMEATCDPGDKVTGGGVRASRFTEIEEYYDFPIQPNLDGWAASGLFTGDEEVTVEVRAVCADLPQPLD